jgi:molybdopterin-binding protein
MDLKNGSNVNSIIFKNIVDFFKIKKGEKYCILLKMAGVHL